MAGVASKLHWETIYKTKGTIGVSWYQERPSKSLELIEAAGAGPTGALIDVGGGASTLVDHLLLAGWHRITVLDISAAALEKAQARLGSSAQAIKWMEGDVTQVTILPHHSYDVWHDRAFFHFLTASEDRQGYLRTLRDALKPGGHVIMATFATDGPPRCSGLDVVRYSPESLSTEFGPEFKQLRSSTETHRTPFSTEQKFIYCLFRKN
jgi:ubiquinone/menaquinone biosynthesis C-methylase UbiE